jgi:O-succinylhomoserine sulfhydrylase
LYLTSSFVFEDAEDICAFAEEEKTGIFTAVTATQITTNLLAKYARKAAAGFAFHWWAAVYSTMAALLNSGITCFFEQCFWCNTLLFINYFPKWNIQTSYFDINQPETIEGLMPDTKILLQSHQPILLLILLIWNCLEILPKAI